MSSSHRHHPSRAPPERDRIQPLHLTPSQSHAAPHPMAHPNGVLHHSIPHSNHASPAMSNGHSHPSQPMTTGPIISPSQSAHPNTTPVMAHLNGHSTVVQKLAKANEETWLLIGEVAEQMSNLDFALTAYEHALAHNPRCVPALSQVAGIARIKENYPKAIDYFQRVVNLPGHDTNGDVWSALGHCYLMQDDLQKAYTAYQQALYHLPNPKEDPKLWYGIGILYDRYGSLDHAEEAFASVLRMDKDFDKANEILFRLGIIYKQQGKYDHSLDCFDRILRSPPSPLAHVDIWFQIGHVYEQQKDYVSAKEAYERVVAENPTHAKVLQQLGWLYHQQGAPFQNQELAIQHLTKSLEADPSDAQSWYLLGRAYMAGQKYNKAYEAYQQAVYRDGRNPTFWCSIGVLYFQISQYRDALDAYSRAIRINPYISEVWFDLGSLYESCNNQISDAIDAYGRAAELDPYNPHIKQRLELLKNVQENGGQLPTAPGPQDVHPTAYASGAGPPGMAGGQPMIPGGPGHPGSQAGRLLFRSESRGSNEQNSLPAPALPPANHPNSPGPFRGGPPPPVILDESRRPSHHTQLAPMEVDRLPITSRDPSYTPGRTGSGGSLLLQQGPTPTATGGHAGLPSSTNDYVGSRRGSPSISPPRAQPLSPPPSFHGGSAYQQQQQQQSRSYGAASSAHASPRTYSSHEPNGSFPASQDAHARHYDRGRDDRAKDRERGRERGLPSRDDYRSHSAGASRYPFDAARGSPREAPRRPPSRDRSSPATWEPRRTSSNVNGMTVLPSMGTRDSPTPVEQQQQQQPPLPPPPRRYDPIHNEREKISNSKSQTLEVERPIMERRIDLSPESYRNGLKTIPSHIPRQTSESPRPDQRRKSRLPKDKDREPDSNDSKRRKKNNGSSKRLKDEVIDTSKGSSYPEPLTTPTSTKPPAGVAKLESPDDKSVTSIGSSSRKPPSPVAPIPRVPPRPVDENYDEGVAETLIGLASQRPIDTISAPPSANSNRSPMSPGRNDSPMNAPSQDQDSAMHSPPPSEEQQQNTLKRPLSSMSVDPKETKRTRTDAGPSVRGTSPGAQRHASPAQSSRPSPIPFRVQASPEIFRSAEMDKERSSAGPSSPSSHVSRSPPAAAVATSGTVTTSHRRTTSSSPRNNASVTLPPIATISSSRQTSATPSEEAVPRGESKPERKALPLIDHGSPQVSTPVSVIGASPRGSP